MIVLINVDMLFERCFEICQVVIIDDSLSKHLKLECHGTVASKKDRGSPLDDPQSLELGLVEDEEVGEVGDESKSQNTAV